MRTLFLLIAFVLIIGVVLVATHVITLSRDGNGTVTLKTNDVSVGTKTTNVQIPVPTVAVGNQTNSQ